MVETEYGAKIIADGKKLLIRTRGEFNLNQTEDTETSELYNLFNSAKATLNTIYSTHRKKARVVFLNGEVILRRPGCIPWQYQRKVGESQDAAKAKNDAMAKMKK
ncbi:MAG: hypothetical protein JW761_00575 [Prolixibacteraceae bacterium]|nr:hypothetical protein [Prolixibacteraceae bacterium]